MKTTQTATAKLQFLQKLAKENRLDIDFENHVRDFDIIETLDDLRDELYETGAFDIEVVYYFDAITYLMENDQSLTESMGLALDLGFTAENLNSCVLASLLQSEEIKDDFAGLESEIEEFFNKNN